MKVLPWWFWRQRNSLLCSQYFWIVSTPKNIFSNCEVWKPSIKQTIGQNLYMSETLLFVYWWKYRRMFTPKTAPIYLVFPRLSAVPSGLAAKLKLNPQTPPTLPSKPPKTFSCYIKVGPLHFTTLLGTPSFVET